MLWHCSFLIRSIYTILGPNQRNVFSGNAVKIFRPAEPFKLLGLPESR